MTLPTIVRSRIAALLFIPVCLAAQLEQPGRGELKTDSVRSSALGSTRLFSVLLPRGYSANANYPVLYLLHGHDGDRRDWPERTSIVQFLADWPLIVVFPDADNSWYVNSYAQPDQRYEEYLLHDLRTAVEHRYAVDTSRRAIAGLSMGGYGALLYGLKYPGMFKFAGSLSGAFAFPRFIEDTLHQPGVKGLMLSLSPAFGHEPNAHRVANDVLALVGGRDGASMPYFYLVTGIQDGFRGFLPVHRMLTDSLRVHNIAYEYRETPGGHSWKYWDQEIRPLLVRMRAILNF